MRVSWNRGSETFDNAHRPSGRTLRCLGVVSNGNGGPLRQYQHGRLVSGECINTNVERQRIVRSKAPVVSLFVPRDRFATQSAFAARLPNTTLIRVDGRDVQASVDVFSRHGVYSWSRALSGQRPVVYKASCAFQLMDCDAATCLCATNEKELQPALWCMIKSVVHAAVRFSFGNGVLARWFVVIPV